MNRRSSLKYTLKETDFVLYIMCILLSAFGSLMVYSATLTEASADGTAVSRDCLMMIIASAIGIFFCIIISMLDYDSLTRLWPIIGGISLLLILALFKWGEAAPGRPDARCWLPIINVGGFSVNFQPSELAKIAFIVTFTAHIDAVKDSINTFKNVLLLTVHAFIPIGLIVITGDLGSAIVFLCIFIGMMFIAGVKLRYFAIAIGLGIVAAPILWIKFLATFHKQRILAIYYPSALTETVYNNVTYQQQKCISAIGSGRFFGDGLFKGTYTQATSGSVPVNESDMVISVVGEELGFIGCICLIAAMAFVIIKIISVGKMSRNISGAMICFGTAFMLASQTVINIGMCLMLLPSIGITLPFISAGGSANLCVYFAIGLVMSVYRFNCDREPTNFRFTHISTPFSET